MTYTIKINDFLLTNVDGTQLINMPSNFTSIEANFFKQLLHQDSDFSEKAILNKSHSNFRKITVDFKRTTFMNSDGLIALCQILSLARDKKINLTFLNFSPQVKMVLSLVGLEHIFCLENSTSFSLLP